MFAPTHLRSTRRDRVILAGLLVGLAVAAWAALWSWQASPYAEYLGHDGDAGSLPMTAILFSLGWLLMIVAMMLPSSTPLVVTFGALVGRRRHPGQLVALLVAGYLAIWSAFGLAAWIADRGVHAAVDRVPWLADHPEIIIGATLAAAGLWQFSPLRDRCLDACRSPLGFVMNRWRGTAERREAFVMGIAHGAFCVGCCWSLMLVMFGLGMGSLGLMFVLGAVTAAEKNLPNGRRISHPLGLVLILAGLYAVAS